MSATATATASDRSDFRTVMVGGTQVGVLTAVAVVVFLFVSRQVTAVVPQRVLVGAVALVVVARLARLGLGLVLPAEAGAGFTIALAALAVVTLARKR